MKRRLPPFAAIKAFEAAAAHCNFQLAAKELGISASAVSHQIKALEDFVGISLFIRRNNRLILREEGKHYYDQLCVALDAIESATDGLMRRSGRAQVTVNLFPSLADVWLIPRLGDFHQKHPDIDVKISTSDLSPDMLNREADFALVYLPEAELPKDAVVLFSDEVIPAAAPSYLANHAPIQTAEDLLKHPLIASLSEADEWPYWLNQHNVSNIGSARYLDLDMCSSCQRAAKEGLGITMGRRPYLDHDLATGKLVAPLPGKLATGYCLGLITTSRGSNLPYGPRFRNWLIEASRASAEIWSQIP